MPRPKFTAHLVLWIRTETLQVTRAEFSKYVAAPGETRPGEHPCHLLQANNDSFEAAVAELRDYLKDGPHYQWVIPLLEQT